MNKFSFLGCFLAASVSLMGAYEPGQEASEVSTSKAQAMARQSLAALSTLNADLVSGRRVNLKALRSVYLTRISSSQASQKTRDLATFNLALMIGLGVGGPENQKLARLMFQQSANSQELPKGQRLFAKVAILDSLTSVGVSTQNAEQVFQLCKELSDLEDVPQSIGFPDVLNLKIIEDFPEHITDLRDYALAVLFKDGLIVPKSSSYARELFKRVLSAGHAPRVVKEKIQRHLREL